MIRRPPRSTHCISSAASDVYKRQYQRRVHGVQEDRAYAVSFWAKASQPGTMRVSIEQTHEPWQVLGGRAEVSLTPQWQHHRIVLSVRASDPAARLVFDPPSVEGSLSLTGISLELEPALGLGDTESLAAGTIPALLRADVGRRTSAAQRDWFRFMWDTEDRYWQTMYSASVSYTHLTLPTICSVQISVGAVSLKKKNKQCRVIEISTINASQYGK
eukprot:TRINITY_DN20339_c0_g1_i1.p2 TRINITY_DN20339_c0_g1~~TRINITY_DN20339_c0_g1_i1.p2  ORF type:complete len:216 (-),score=34.83 TRINITY_DN20339_c0_g1_i1:34-681(-)